jgi:hypothetical protein
VFGGMTDDSSCLRIYSRFVDTVICRKLFWLVDQSTCLQVHTTPWLFRPTIFTSASHLDNRLRATIKLLDLLKILWDDRQKMTWVFSNDGSTRLKIVNILLEHILLVILLCSSHGTVIFNADWTPSLKSLFYESRCLRNMIERLLSLWWLEYNWCEDGPVLFQWR